MLPLLACLQSEPTTPRVLVLGIDGLDAEVVDQLVSEGRMPNFAGLKRQGAHGVLMSDPPMLSPILWTTMATGQTPDRHGIGSFAVGQTTDGEKQPVTSTMRRTKAVWNIASDLGRRVGVVGWWATWPPEEINGVMVSDHTCYHFLFGEGQSGAARTQNSIFPDDRAADLEALIRRPSDITFDEASRYINVEKAEFNREFDFADDVSHFRWALATADSYSRIGKRIWQADRPDLMMVYIEGTDSISHLFGHLFRAGSLAGDLAEQQRRYGHAVEEIYVYADQLVGEFMDLMDEETTLMVISDHGFKLGALHDDPTVTTSMKRVSEDFHDLDGIIYLGGHGVRPGAVIDNPRQIDITPTVLHLLGLPAAADMPGRVLADVLTGGSELARVDTYEDGAGSVQVSQGDASVSREVIAHLEALGYLGGDEEPAVNRAAADMLLNGKRFDEAAAAFASLIETDPENAALYLNLGVALSNLDRDDEAFKALERARELDPTNAMVFFNLGLLAERRGDTATAAEMFRTTLRYETTHESARARLEEITGRSRVYEPKNEAERQASDLAARAAQLTRQGAYPAASNLLDQAEKLAPELPLVHQYRANVAYLQGDLDGAISALERSLELEPGNERVRKNLETLVARRDNGTD